MKAKPKRYEILARVGVDDLDKVKSALTSVLGCGQLHERKVSPYLMFSFTTKHYIYIRQFRAKIKAKLPHAQFVERRLYE